MKNNVHSCVKYRKELFGVATLMILLCHSVSIVPFPDRIGTFISYGTMGVNVFLFLSGIGLYYSFNKNGDIIAFYKKRFMRVIVPYLFIAGFWYGVKYLIMEGGRVDQFIYELSTISFWNEHKGAWFVAAIIPIYIIYPVLYRWLEKGRRKSKTSILVLIILLSAFYLSNINAQLYIHLSQIIIGGIVFLIGNCVADSIKNNNFKGKYLFIFGIIIFAIKSTTLLKNSQLFCDISVGFLSISLIFILNIFIKFCGGICRKVLIKIGTISLESYLHNIFLLQAVKYWENIFLCNQNMNYRVGLYVIIMILGLVLSLFSQIILKTIMNNMEG